MARLKIHFELTDNSEKLPLGPMSSPKPGPTLEMDVAAAEIEVIKLRPETDNKAVTIKNMTMYKNINDITDDINLSSIFCFSYFKLNTP